MNNYLGWVLKGDAARGAFEEALKINQDLFDEEDNAITRRDLAMAPFRLGDFFARQKKEAWTSAERHFKLSLDLVKILSDRDPKNAAWLRDLAPVHSRLGGLYLILKEFAKAQVEFESQLNLRCQLQKRDEENIIWLTALATASKQLGDLHRTRSKQAYQQLAGLKADVDLLLRRHPPAGNYTC